MSFDPQFANSRALVTGGAKGVGAAGQWPSVERTRVERASLALRVSTATCFNVELRFDSPLALSMISGLRFPDQCGSSKLLRILAMLSSKPVRSSPLAHITTVSFVQ
jgi:hypothetical protein